MKNENTAEYNYCITVGQTDVGKRRRSNEDHGAHFVSCNGLVSVVCDGMGGHVGGAVASEVAINAIREFLDSNYYEDPREAIGLAIETANKAILRKVAEEPQLTGMGSTCVLLIVRDAKVYIGHVGDSRIYLIRERRITQLTKDQSFVQMLVDMGELTPEEAAHHPRKNEITNALGLPNSSPAIVKEDAVTPQAGDCFVLCSDGMSGMVPDRDIERIVSKQRELSTQARADLLVKTANDNGGPDNITVELVEFTVTPEAVVGGGKAIGKKKAAWIAGAAALVCVAAAVAVWMLCGRATSETASMGEVEFESRQPVFIVSANPADKTTIVQSGDSVKVINRQLTEKVVVSTNLETKKTGSTYTLTFGEGISGGEDAYVTIQFGKHSYSYSVSVKGPEKPLPLVELEPNTLKGKVNYAKNKVFASITFVPVAGEVVLSVVDADPIKNSGKLDTESVEVEGAETVYSRSGATEKWSLKFTSDVPKSVTVSFICEDENSRTRYTYVIPVTKSRGITNVPKSEEPKPESQTSPEANAVAAPDQPPAEQSSENTEHKEPDNPDVEILDIDSDDVE